VPHEYHASMYHRSHQRTFVGLSACEADNRTDYYFFYKIVLKVQIKIEKAYPAQYT